MRRQSTCGSRTSICARVVFCMSVFFLLRLSARWHECAMINTTIAQQRRPSAYILLVGCTKCVAFIHYNIMHATATAAAFWVCHTRITCFRTTHRFAAGHFGSDALRRQVDTHSDRYKQANARIDDIVHCAHVVTFGACICQVSIQFKKASIAQRREA